MQSSEELRETVVSLSSANDHLRTEVVQANLLLRVLESLLQVGVDDDPFSSVFDSLKASSRSSRRWCSWKGRTAGALPST
jgi:hypothetical protein